MVRFGSYKSASHSFWSLIIQKQHTSFLFLSHFRYQNYIKSFQKILILVLNPPRPHHSLQIFCYENEKFDISQYFYIKPLEIDIKSRV
jgi:hypothetical protein